MRPDSDFPGQLLLPLALRPLPPATHQDSCLSCLRAVFRNQQHTRTVSTHTHRPCEAGHPLGQLPQALAKPSEEVSPQVAATETPATHTISDAHTHRRPFRREPRLQILFMYVQSDFPAHVTESSHTRKLEYNIFLLRTAGNSCKKPSWLATIPRCRIGAKRILTDMERLLGEVSDGEEGNLSAEEASGVILCAE